MTTSLTTGLATIDTSHFDEIEWVDVWVDRCRACASLDNHGESLCPSCDD